MTGVMKRTFCHEEEENFILVKSKIDHQSSNYFGFQASILAAQTFMISMLLNNVDELLVPVETVTKW